MGSLGISELILLAIIAVAVLWFVLKLVRSLPGISISTQPKEHHQSEGRGPDIKLANAFCTKCGAALSDDIVFCGKCGMKRS